MRGELSGQLTYSPDVVDCGLAKGPRQECFTLATAIERGAIRNKDRLGSSLRAGNLRAIAIPCQSLEPRTQHAEPRTDNLAKSQNTRLSAPSRWPLCDGDGRMCATPSPSPLRDRDSILGGARGRGEVRQPLSPLQSKQSDSRKAEKRRARQKQRARERRRQRRQRTRLSYHAGVPVLGTTAYAAAQVG